MSEQIKYSEMGVHRVVDVDLNQQDRGVPFETKGKLQTASSVAFLPKTTIND